MKYVYVDLILEGRRKLLDVKPKALYEEVRLLIINKYVELINNSEKTIKDVPEEIVEDVKQKLN